MSDELEVTRLRTGIEWGEQRQMQGCEIEPTMWAWIDSGQGNIFVAVERIDGQTARAQCFGDVIGQSADRVDDVFEFSVNREDSIQDIARSFLDEPEDSIRRLVNEREETDDADE